MRLRHLIPVAIGAAVLVCAAALTFDYWKTWLPFIGPEVKADDDHHHFVAPDQVKLSPQALANLQLVVQPVRLREYWRTIQVPGQVIELPGRSDHAVTSPVGGVVKRIAVSPWHPSSLAMSCSRWVW